MIDFTAKHYAARTHGQMQDVLMVPDTPGPAVHYHMVRGGSEQRNITIWEPGSVGGEYIKTYGHYHVGELDETYWVLYGEGIAVVQKRVEGPDGPIDEEIEGLYVVKVKAGDALYMPSGWGHLVVNIGGTFLVTADDSPVNFADVDPVSLPGHADYDAVKRMRGFAYYVVEQNGQPALVRNQRYKRVPAVGIINSKDYPLRDTGA